MNLVAIELQDELFYWAVTFIEALLSTIIAINVHRIVLQGEDSVPKWGRFTIGKIELWFFAHYSALLVGVYVIFLLTPLIGAVVGILAIVAGVISCRLSLVFPAIALGQGVSFPYAWHQTAQKTLYMFCVVAVTPFIFGFFLVPFALLSVPPALLTFLSYVVTIITVIALSFAYQNLTEKPKPLEPNVEE
ncbi:hypothetical protein [Enterovibrio calviensis]|uniref:hypothetical protein n=1 Tax=Enterovibrio calviensis TaxID=91359 RepID=UPI001FE1B935|nr:hypothetical protein [Enterovibrio calviensis]